MCGNTVSVGWDGKVFDCDFNQQLQIDMPARGGAGTGVSDSTGGKAIDVFAVESLDELLKVRLLSAWPLAQCFRLEDTSMGKTCVQMPNRIIR